MLQSSAAFEYAPRIWITGYEAFKVRQHNRQRRRGPAKIAQLIDCGPSFRQRSSYFPKNNPHNDVHHECISEIFVKDISEFVLFDPFSVLRIRVPS